MEHALAQTTEREGIGHEPREGTAHELKQGAGCDVGTRAVPQSFEVTRMLRPYANSLALPSHSTTPDEAQVGAALQWVTVAKPPNSSTPFVWCKYATCCGEDASKTMLWKAQAGPLDQELA